MKFRIVDATTKLLFSAIAVIFSTRLSAGSVQDISLFRVAEPSASIQKNAADKIRKIQWLQHEQKNLEILYQKKHSRISIQVPTKEGWCTLDLVKAEVESPGFIVRTSGGQRYEAAFEKVLSYRGNIRGKKQSFAAFSIGKDEVSAVFSAGEGNYNLVKHRESSGDLYAIFNDRDILEENPFLCHSDDLPAGGIPATYQSKNPGITSIQTGSCRRTDFYFECDHQLFLDQGGTVTGAVNFVQSMFNVVATLYALDGVNIRISEIFVHTEPDNYPSSTSFEALDAFSDSVLFRPAFNGNLGHLLSTLPRANGGVAYLDVICAQGTGVNIAYSNIYSSFLPLPYYSWNINVVAHEIGHNFGSPHTQSCSWELSPGVYGMLDSCYIAEGDCYSGPRIATVGTIMSYCHLMNLGVDFSKGFGPKPGTLIRTNYLNAACLPGAVEFPALSISPADTICNGSTLSLSVTAVDGATYQWTGPAGFSAGTASISIPNAGPAQAGEYQVSISKDGCDALPLSTRVSVNCIYAIPRSNRIPCSRDHFDVEYLSTITPNPGNQFRVEISDPSGNFSNATQIGSLNSTARSGLIPVLLPPAILPDSGYKIRIKSTNPVSTGEAGFQALRILPLPASPTGTSQNRCGPGSLQLQAQAAQPGDSIFWYSSENSDVRLASGPVFQTPVLTNSSSYWVASQRIRKDQIGPVPNFNSGDTLFVFNTYHGIYMKVKKAISLDSVLIFAGGPGLLHINIKDSANTFRYKKIIRQVAGSAMGEKIYVGAELSPGIYRIDAESSTVPTLLRLNNFFSFPIVSEGVDITSSSVPGRYYYFYNWKISLPECPGLRKEIRAEIYPQPEKPQLSLSGQFLISSADTLQQWFKDGVLLGVFDDSLDTELFGNGQYQTVITTANACSDSSNILAVIFTATGNPGKLLMRHYPNPVSDFMQLEFPQKGTYRLQCLDACGRRVWEGNCEESMQLDFRFLPSGSYALLVQGNSSQRGWYLFVKE